MGNTHFCEHNKLFTLLLTCFSTCTQNVLSIFRCSLSLLSLMTRCHCDLQLILHLLDRQVQSDIVGCSTALFGVQHCPLCYIREYLKTHVDPFSKRHPKVITRQRASEFIIREAYLFIKLTTVLASFHYSQGLENSNKTPRTDSYTRITLCFLSKCL
jgi:hypothetical protein